MGMNIFIAVMSAIIVTFIFEYLRSSRPWKMFSRRTLLIWTASGLAFLLVLILLLRLWPNKLTDNENEQAIITQINKDLPDEISPTVDKTEKITATQELQLLNKKEVVLEKTLDEEVISFVDRWRIAWEDSAGDKGDIGNYGSYYADDFRGGVQNRAVWLADKARKNSKKDWIKVEVSEIKVRSLSDKELEVSFQQTYSSSNYSQKSHKIFKLRKDYFEWKIVSER